MADDNEIRAKLTADASELRSALEEAGVSVEQFITVLKTLYKDAESAVKSSLANLTQAQEAFGTAAAQGVQPAIAAIQLYETELLTATTAQQALAAQLVVATSLLTTTANAGQSAANSVRNVGASAQQGYTGLYQFYIGLSLLRKGFEEFDKFRKSEEELRLLSEASGVAVEKIGEFKGAVNLAGGEGDKFAVVLMRLARAQEQIEQGQPRMIDDFKRLGITAKEPIEMLMQLADTLHNTKDKYEALGAAEQVLSQSGGGAGVSQAELFGILSGGSAVIRANMAASKEYAYALDQAIASADQLTSAEVAVKQAIAIVTAESFPAIVSAIQTVIAVFEMFVTGVKVVVDTVIHGFWEIEGSVTTATAVIDKALHLNWSGAAAETKNGLTLMKGEWHQYVQDLNKDSDEAHSFIERLYAVPNKPAPGAGLSFPKPAQKPEKNTAGEAEEDAELAHLKRLEAMDLEAANSQLTIERLTDAAFLEELTDKHERALALAEAEVVSAREKQAEEDKIRSDYLTKELAALDAKEALQSADGKTSIAEIARSEREKQTLIDEASQKQLELAEGVATAVVKFNVVAATQSREAWAESFADLTKWATEGKRVLQEAGEEYRKIADLKATAATAGDIGGLEQNKLELEREYALSLDHSLGAQVALGKATIDIDEQILKSKVALETALAQNDINNPVKYQQDMTRIAAISAAGHAQITAATTRNLVLQQAAYVRFFDLINQQFASSVTKWIMGQESFSKAMDQVWRSIVTTFITNLIKMTVAHLAQTLIQLAQQQSAAAASIAISKIVNIQQQLLNAKAAASGAYAAVSLIPYVGPILAPIAAGVAFAAVLAFEQGGIVPNTGLILAHKNEAVLPAPLTATLLSAAGGGSGVTLNGGIHVHNPGSNAQGRQIGQDIFSSFRTQLRKSNMRVAGSARSPLG